MGTMIQFDAEVHYLIIDCREGVDNCFFMGWSPPDRIGTPRTYWCNRLHFPFATYQDAVIEREMILANSESERARHLAIQPVVVGRAHAR